MLFYSSIYLLLILYYNNFLTISYTHMHTTTALTHLGLLKITGTDAKKFLQGQLTCNLEEVTSSQSRVGAHCNPQGRIISLFRIFLYSENYYLQMPRELIPIAMKALQKYAVFFKITLSDASHELYQIGYEGAIDSYPHKTDEQYTSDTHILIKLPYALPRYLKISRANEKIFTDTISKWKKQDILQQIPAIYPETSEKFLPHELNLPALNAVSFNKGCYTGQEIIARLHYRGKLKTELQHLTLELPREPIPGQELSTNVTIVDYC